MFKGNGVKLEGNEDTLKDNGKAIKGNAFICNEEASKAVADA